MSLAGLHLERTILEDFTGIFSFILLSYILAPFQAFAALKGLIERDEGGWIRTLKTGSITNTALHNWLCSNSSGCHPRGTSRLGSKGW